MQAREVADLHGAALLPGFHDAHNHMAWFGLSLSEADLRPEFVIARRAVRARGDWQRPAQLTAQRRRVL